MTLLMRTAWWIYFMASTSTAWSGSPLLQSQHLPLISSSPIHYPTSPLPPNSPKHNLCITPNSFPTTPVATRQFPQLPPLTSTSSQAVPSTRSTTIPPDDEIEELPLCPELVDQLLRGPVSWKPSSVSSACNSRCVGLRLVYSPNYLNYLFLLALDLNV